MNTFAIVAVSSIIAIITGLGIGFYLGMYFSREAIRRGGVKRVIVSKK